MLANPLRNEGDVFRELDVAADLPFVCAAAHPTPTLIEAQKYSHA